MRPSKTDRDLVPAAFYLYIYFAYAEESGDLGMDSYMRNKLAGRLDDDLGISLHKMIAITGGGGKTSLMYALGRHFSQKEKTVITTTAKIFVPPVCEFPELYTGPPEGCIETAEKMDCCTLLVAAKEQNIDKLTGYTDFEIEKISKSTVIGKLIVEADGSRGLSLKGYEDWEPPVPRLAACQIIVLGADAFTLPMSPSSVFRLENLKRDFGVQEGEILSAGKAADIVSSRSGYLKNSPENAYRILFINKFELFAESARQHMLDKFISGLKGYDTIVAASLNMDTVYAITKLDRE